MIKALHERAFPNDLCPGAVVMCDLSDELVMTPTRGGIIPDGRLLQFNVPCLVLSVFQRTFDTQLLVSHPSGIGWLVYSNSSQVDVHMKLLVRA